MSDLAVSVQNLSKCYQIYDKPSDRLKQFLSPIIQRAGSNQSQNYFKEFWALRDVSFDIKKGETLGVVGVNGSGKSTLLQLICGTISPSAGKVETYGRIAALLELGSGFNPEFTGRENVYYNALILGLNDGEVDDRFDEISSFADIGNFIDLPVKTYSSGMYVRLAFAVHAMLDPDILIVDEALAVGDEKFQRKCFLRLEKLKDQGSSIIFVSHSSENISQLCEKALLLNHGTRLMLGPPLGVLTAYQKLLYAPVENQTDLINEIMADSSESPALENQFDIFKLNESSNKTGIFEKQDFERSEGFDQNLVPETTTIFPVQGAVIESISIANVNGKIVNVLQPGDTYSFLLTGRFLSDFSGVYFGIHIKSVSGVAITGQIFPEEGRYIEGVLAGQVFKVNFSFKMNLLPGVYFVGGGIWSREEPNCAHRIFDAIMFRVAKTDKANSFALVDMRSAEAILDIRVVDC